MDLASRTGRLHRALSAAGVVLAAGALWLVERELGDYDLADVGAALQALPAARVALALGLTVLNYAVLTGYDWLALRYAGERLAYRRSALASFVAFAFSIALGHAVITGGAVRYRLYAAWDVPAEKTAAVIAFCGLAFWVGFLSLGGAVFAVAPPPAPSGFPVAPRVLGGVFLALFAVWVALNAVRTRPLRVWRWTVALPGLPATLGQVAIASADLTVAAGVLWLLLPAGSVGFGTLLAVYLLANVAGVVSLVPGGLGVFDGLVVALLAPAVPTSVALGAVVAYRALYYLLPFAVAAVTLAATEAARRRARRPR